MENIGKTTLFISEEEKPIESSIYLQNEAKKWYFVSPYNMSPKL